LIHLDPAAVGNIVNSRTIFLNRCTGGCKVTSADSSDSRLNKSSIGGGTLAAFSEGDSVWNQVVSCVKQTFSRFNVDVVDKDPGPYVNHFEIMIGGDPNQLGLPSGVGGIAEYSCTGIGSCSLFVPNALVFVFDVWGGDVNEICATAAQELAHTFSGMDHVVDPSDPMTYALFSGMRNFKDNVQCGSDCDYSCSGGTGSCNAFGITCTGSGATGTHICMSSGTSTQNDIQIITSIFGPATAAAPTLTLTNPTNLSGQPRGFTIEANCTASDPIAEVVFEIDGARQTSVTAAPYKYTTPATLADGFHHVSVICGTSQKVVSVANADVIVGAPCVKSVCAAGYVCYDDVCIAGPDSAGGVGATCTTSSECQYNGTCASDGETMACTIPCDLDNPNCPEGFGCLDAGSMGVCWEGIDDGGCCETGGGKGSVLLALGLGTVLITRKRRRAK